MDGPAQTDRTAEVAGWLRAARCSGGVTVLTGAGVSTDSGIPDYRGPNGLWTRDPGAQRQASIQVYVRHPEVRRRAWRARLTHPAWRAEPGPAHRALAALGVGFDPAGPGLVILTQNVDGLHQRAGSPPGQVVELHGTIWQAQCLDCGRRTPMREELARVEAGLADPPCRECGGLLKSATVSFGQALDPAVLARAVQAARGSAVFLAAGSSLTVRPAAGLCSVAGEAGARLVIANAEPTPYDGVADAVLREPLGTLLPRLVRLSAPLHSPGGR